MFIIINTILYNIEKTIDLLLEKIKHNINQTLPKVTVQFFARYINKYIKNYALMIHKAQLCLYLGLVKFLKSVSCKQQKEGTRNQTNQSFPTPNIVSCTDYYPFGMAMGGRNGSVESYRYGFNGVEKDDEVKGQGNSYSFKFRIYDSRLGKFLSVDPLSREYPWNSPYAFAENDVIRAIDLEGLEKYIIHQRSFAPWSEFGDIMPLQNGGYEGDNRGFSTQYKTSTGQPITSRIVVQSTVDYGKSKIEKVRDYSDPSTGPYGFWGPTTTKTGDPDVTKSNLYEHQVGGYKQLEYNSSFQGSNPLVPGSPAIMWSSQTHITWAEDANMLSIIFKGNGKGFPAYESFIEDEAGTRLMMGGYGPPNKGRIDRLNMYPGMNVPIIQFPKNEMLIQTDDSGNFMGVYDPNTDTVMSPDAWNAQQTSTPAAGDLE